MKCGAIRGIIGGKIPFDPNIIIYVYFVLIIYCKSVKFPIRLYKLIYYIIPKSLMITSSIFSMSESIHPLFLPCRP